MTTFAIHPISDELAKHVRTHRADPVWEHPAHECVPEAGPCRSCLGSVAGEPTLLFTHDSFAGRGEFKMPGPVYIHAARCEPYAESDSFPDWARGKPLTFEAYGPEVQLLAVERDHGDHGDEIIERPLAEHPGAEYVNVRNTAAGCFLMRADRAA
jgi:Protein of unknown function (DUF1203)